MKVLIPLALVLALVPGPAIGQAGSIGLFADIGGTDCNLLDTSSGLVSYHVVHLDIPGAMACQFSAPQPGCFIATWLSDTQNFAVTIGDSQFGVSVAYGQCLSSPIHVLSINFFTQGLTSKCCGFPLLPDPNTRSGDVEAVDCSNDLLVARGLYGRVNRDGSCPCDQDIEATWGGVKAVYSR